MTNSNTFYQGGHEPCRRREIDKVASPPAEERRDLMGRQSFIWHLRRRTGNSAVAARASRLPQSSRKTGLLRSGGTRHWTVVIAKTSSGLDSCDCAARVAWNRVPNRPWTTRIRPQAVVWTVVIGAWTPAIGLA